MIPDIPVDGFSLPNTTIFPLDCYEHVFYNSRMQRSSDGFLAIPIFLPGQPAIPHLLSKPSRLRSAKIQLKVTLIQPPASYSSPSFLLTLAPVYLITELPNYRITFLPFFHLTNPLLSATLAM